MNYQELSSIKTRFLQRRYATRLGRRYVSAAAGVIIGLCGTSRLDMIVPIADRDSYRASATAMNTVLPSLREDVFRSNGNHHNSGVAQTLPLQQQVPPTNEQLQMSQIDAIMTAHTKFGFKLFSEILKQNSSQDNQNTFISPISVAIALAMTYNGASGETQQAMTQTLELEGINLQQVNSANAALIAALQNPDEKVQLNIANSLWARQDAPLKPDFLERNQNFYNANVTNLDFSAPNAANIINNWVQQNTSGKIERIIEKISSDEVLFLINAIYFKGRWTTEFDEKQTAEHPFYLAAGGQKEHPMMSQSGKYKYYETEKFQAISLPYGNNSRLSLYVFLPSQDSSLAEFSQTLNPQSWDKWMTLFRNRQGSIQLPRFKIESDLTLNDTLKALGMEVAFGEKGDFSGISDNLALSEVKHKTLVEVNEEGTEAAAATSVGVTLVSANVEQPFEMLVNRPFFCAIRDNQTGAVLFMGSIVEP